jgi:hypothetical protein
VENGVAVCTHPRSQYIPDIASDGAGGAIITWFENRNEIDYDIYAQRVNASGNPLWTPDGVAICSAARDQEYPDIVSDGVGGAIIVWSDYRSMTNYDVFAQRVDASGNALWTPDGLAVCTAMENQQTTAIVTDGEGGVIIVWCDQRNGNVDLYAQRVSAKGTVHWTADGVAFCTQAADQYNPQIASDGEGGAIVTWFDDRNGAFDIYAQRVDAWGDIQWTSSGVPVCTAAEDQQNQAIVPDGEGGAIISWHDYRNPESDIYAQRIDASGTVQWTANGIAVCVAVDYQWQTMIDTDNAGGAVIAWQDGRNGTDDDIYAQRVDASGNALWTTDGVPICATTGFQHNPDVVSDGGGGAIVVWWDHRGAYMDAYAQRVNGSGTTLWTDNGLAICTAPDDQRFLSVTGDGAQGALMAWEDERTGGRDIYAQCIDADGRVGMLAPEIVAVRDIPGDQGGQVYISWEAARSDRFPTGDLNRYGIWRAISPAAAAMMIETGATVVESPAGFDPDSGKPVVRIERVGGLDYFWDFIEIVDAANMETYGEPVETLFDSTAVCGDYHYFQVVAYAYDPYVFWESEPDSGYSVDNLAPGPPLGMTGEQSFDPVGLSLAWAPNEEPDLGCYRVYRGLSAFFEPSASNLIGEPCEESYFDEGWRWSEGYCYKVCAVDIHGNESGYTLFGSDEVTGEDTPPLPQASYLSQNYPNPFNPSTRIEFGLATPGHVSLRVYDALGRLVRVIVDENRSAGRHVESWDGRDGEGGEAASGVYFYRLTAGDLKATRKMVLAR